MPHIEPVSVLTTSRPISDVVDESYGFDNDTTLTRLNHKSMRVREEFLDAMSDLLSGRKQGHVVEQLYYKPDNLPFGQAGGNEYYDRAILLGAQSGYYVPTREISLIYDSIVPQLPTAINGAQNVVEFGPGKVLAVASKTKPTLQALVNKNLYSVRSDDALPINYCALDLHADSALVASKAVSAEFDPRHVNVSYKAGDFTQDQKLPFEGGRTLGIMYGITAGNFPIDSDDKGETTLGQMLSGVRSNLGRDGYLLLTVDTNRNRESVVASYSGQHFADFFQNVWRVLPLVVGDKRNDKAYKASNIHYAPEFSGHKLIHAYQSAKRHSVFIRGKEHIIPAGGRYVAGYSCKYKISDVQKVAENNGYHAVRTFKQYGNPIQGLLLQCK